MVQLGTTPLFEQVYNLAADAVCAGEHIALRHIRERVAEHSTLVPCGSGCAALFRYGVVVFFGVDETSQRSFLGEIREWVSNPFEEPEKESIDIRIDPNGREGVANEQLVLADASLGRLQVVAEVLAKSVALAQYEEAMASMFARVEPLAEGLRAGETPERPKALLRHIGDALLIQHRMVGRAEVSEKPELSWDNPALDRLYIRLAEEYELRDRHTALERKLGVISDTAETLLELLQARRSLRVEWYIVLLIVFEIVLTLYSMAAGIQH